MTDHIRFDYSSAGVETAAAKDELRRDIEARMTKISAEERSAASARLVERIQALPQYAEARSVLLYSALPDEVDMDPIMDDLLGRGRELLLPVLNIRESDISIVSVADPRRELRDGAYGILEPLDGMPLSDLNGIDFVIVPGRSFDAAGRRLGRGRGCYDEFLARLKPFGSGGPMKLGVAFACQLSEAVPTGPLDVSMDAVATESTFIRPD